MTNARLRQIGKERAIELEESGKYLDTRAAAFHEYLVSFIEETETVVSEEDIEGLLDSFEFPTEEEWIADKVESEYGDYIDQAYDQMRDDQLTGD